MRPETHLFAFYFRAAARAPIRCHLPDERVKLLSRLPVRESEEVQLLAVPRLLRHLFDDLWLHDLTLLLRLHV